MTNDTSLRCVPSLTGWHGKWRPTTPLKDHANALFGLTDKKASVFSRMFAGAKKKKGSAATPAQFFESISHLRWLPVVCKAPRPHMPWVPTSESNITVASPKHCRTSTDIWLCSATLRIIAQPIRSQFILEHLGLLQDVYGDLASGH